jgi:hypothetical protein
MISLDAPPTLDRQPGDFKRDAREGVYVSDPNGATVKSGKRQGEIKWVRYGRPSSLGKQIENTYNLQRWNERQLAHGMTCEDDELTSRLVALGELERDTNPWNDAADAVIARAKKVADANIAAERGTHMHAVVEDDSVERNWVVRAEAGENMGLPVAVQEAMLEAYRLMLIAYGLRVLCVERRVVHDKWRQAGTLDAVCILERDIAFVLPDGEVVTLAEGTIVVLDLKTGKLYDAKGKSKIDAGYWHSYCVQIAAYAGAVPYDCDTDTRTEWEWDIDQRWALIAHLPVDEALAGKATCRLVLVDLELGRDVVENVVLPAKAWQARRDLFAHVSPNEPTVELAVEVDHEPDATVDLLEQSIVEESNRSIHERPTPEDEGPFIKPDEVAELKAMVKQLDPQAYAMFEAARAERPFSIAHPTKRRSHIYWALIRLGQHFGADLEEDHVRASLALVLPEAAMPGVFLGHALGTLTLDEAKRLSEITTAAVGAALTYDDAGRPTWLGVDNPAA